MNSNLQDCPDCGGKMSKNALACPTCGAVNKNKKTLGNQVLRIVIGIVLFCLALVAIGVLTNAYFGL